jgi:hypothetical protein
LNAFRKALTCVVVLAASSAAFADRLFAVDGAGGATASLYELDPTTGAIIQTIGSTGFAHVTGISFNPLTGQLYGVVSDSFSGGGSLISIDLTTGAGTLIGSTSSQIPDISFSSSGVLYGWVEFGVAFDQLATIDLTTGAVTAFAPSTGTSNTGLAFAPNGTLYLKPGGSLYTLDPTTGVSTFVTSLSTNPQNLLAFDSTGTMFSGIRNSGTFTLVTIDPTTGTVTSIGSNGAGSISAIAFQPLAIPEPGSIALMGLGGVALLGFVRRRKAAKTSPK